MVYRTRRRVLRHSPMADVINELAQSYGWPVVYEADRNFDRGKGREVNWGVTREVVLGYLESHLSNDCCIVAVGKDSELAERVIRQMDDDLEDEIESFAELPAAIQDDEDPRHLAQSLVLAGFGAPRQFDQEFFAAFAKAAREHDEYRVRDIAISSVVYIEWPEFRPLLEEIQAHDSEEQVRARTAIVLRAYKARNSYSSGKPPRTDDQRLTGPSRSVETLDLAAPVHPVAQAMRVTVEEELLHP